MASFLIIKHEEIQMAPKKLSPLPQHSTTNYKTIYFAVFLITLAVKILFLFQQVNYGINLDRIGDLAAPVTLAGLDWKALIAESRYYGYGFKWLYFPFFLMTDNPYTIYYAITLLYSVLMSLVAVLVYHIQRKYLRAGDGILPIIIAVFMGVAGTCDMKSESSVYIACWLACFFIVKLVSEKDEKKKRYTSIALALFLSYAVTLHERMVALILAFAIFVFLYRWKYRRWVVTPVIYAAVQAVSWFLIDKINDIYRLYFWADTKVSNSSVISSTVNHFYFLQNWQGLKTAVYCTVSNIFTLGMQTFGLGWIIICIFAFSIMKSYKNIQEKQKMQPTGKHTIPDNTPAGQNTALERDRELHAVIWFFGLCIAITIAGLVVNWGSKVYDGRLYSYKGFVYGRYYLCYAYPAMMAALIWIRQHRVNMKTLALCWGLGIAGVLLFLKKIYPILQWAYTTYIPTETTSDTALYWLLYYSFTGNQDITLDLKINLIFVVICLILLTLAMVKNADVDGIAAIMTATAVFVGTAGFSFHMPNVVFTMDIYHAAYDYVHELETAGVLTADKTIYTNYQPWTLQFLLNRYSIVYEYPKRGETAIMISGGDQNDVYEQLAAYGGYYCLAISDTEFLYSNDEDLYQQLQDAGHNVAMLSDIGSAGTLLHLDNVKTLSIPGVTDYTIVVLNDLHNQNFLHRIKRCGAQ